MSATMPRSREHHPAIRFRDAGRDDLPAITGWIRSPRECELWAGPGLAYPPDPDLLAGDIEYYRADSIIMLDGDRRLAFGQLLSMQHRRCLIARFIVDPDRRRRGHGQQLLAELLRRAGRDGYRRIALNVDRDNHAAQQMYLSQGFRFSARPRGETASNLSLYMSRKL